MGLGQVWTQSRCLFFCNNLHLFPFTLATLASCFDYPLYSSQQLVLQLHPFASSPSVSQDCIWLEIIDPQLYWLDQMWVCFLMSRGRLFMASKDYFNLAHCYPELNLFTKKKKKWLLVREIVVSDTLFHRTAQCSVLKTINLVSKRHQKICSVCFKIYHLT